MMYRNVVLILGVCGGMASVQVQAIPIKTIKSTQAPEPIGPYSQAIQASCKQQLFISGQIPLDQQTGILHTEITAATFQVMNNIQAILREAGMDFKNVVKTTIYLINMNDFAVVNSVYASYFKDTHNFPARDTVQVAALPKGACIEISMIAVQ